MSFSFHRIPVGIDNCFLLRGERTIFVDSGAPGGLNPFVNHRAAPCRSEADRV